ncbi:MAG: shikimate kinase [Lactobacillales bacterium]|jgi:shikimate kinase|nr:shikimate kinase [Lactobacillales bacterium]
MKYKLSEPKIILLVGMMGVGKTSLGRILSKRLDLPFIDSDKEIEKSTGFSISDLFARFGESEFRIGEEKIMKRLLKGTPCILSSGGGAFFSEKTRLVASEYAVSVWIKAPTEVISKRTQGRTHRPLVPSFDNKKAIEKLIKEHYPFYALADITVESYNEPPFRTVMRVLKELEKRAIVSSVSDGGQEGVK